MITGSLVVVELVYGIDTVVNSETTLCEITGLCRLLWPQNQNQLFWILKFT